MSYLVNMTDIRTSNEEHRTINEKQQTNSKLCPDTKGRL